MRGLVQSFACAALLAVAVPLAASADALSDYVSARDQAIAASIAAAKADKSGDEAVVKREEAAMKDLPKRLGAALGPLKFKGLGSPTYSLNVFTFDVADPTRQLDGLSFANTDVTTRLVVTPDSVFQAWLAARSKDPDAPAALAGGVKSAMGTTDFYVNALSFDGGYFQPYMELPVAAAPGETVLAMLGLQTEEAAGNSAPGEIVIVRIADGKAIVGLTQVKLDIKPIAACEAVWKPYKAKANALTKAAEKDNKSDDPRWNEIEKILGEGSEAYRACFVKEAPAQPFFSAATKRAGEFLQIARGS